MKPSSTFLDKGQLKQDSDDTYEFEFPDSSSFFAAPTNLIPGLGGVSGGRVLLGDKSSLQALSLVHREAPLVRSSSSEKSLSFVSSLGKELGTISSRSSGEIVAVSDSEIRVKDDKGEQKYELYNNYNLGRKSFISNSPVVKVGDRVKKGQMLANSNFTDKAGNLALGINLKTAVMPYRSANFEDAFVVTESGAKKLVAEQLVRVRVEKQFGVETSKGKYISLFPNKFTNAQLSKLDDDGAVKKGTKVQFGDPVILAMSPKPLKTSELQLGKLSKALKNAFTDMSETWDLEHEGEVVDVSKSGSLITVNVKTVRGLQVGDKISSAFGNKGVVGRILSDSEAPMTSDGKPVDLILNSMSITSRVSPGIAVAMALGKYAQKTGKPKRMTPFINGSAVEKTRELLKKNDIEDVEELHDPVTGRKLKAFVGPLFVGRLSHIAEDKISERGQGLAYTTDLQPGHGIGESSKRIGNLSTTAILSSGATAVLRDMAIVRSTKNDEYWRRLKLGQPIPTPKSPFVFDKFLASLQGAGVKVDKHDDIYQILPQTDKDIEALSAGPVENALTFKVRNDQLVPEKGGLFDPSKVGVLGERYNHINLNAPIPNPISEEFLQKMLGLTGKKYMDMLVSGELIKKLKEINLEQEIKKNEGYLASGKKTARNNSVKVLAFLKALRANGLHPSDLILTKVPVIPAQFRPIVMQGDMVLPAPVNLLYKDLILHNNGLKNLSSLPLEVQRRAKLGHYEAIKAVFGLGEATTVKNREKSVRGLLATTLGLQGGSAKGSMFQAHVVNKPLDLVGRAVLSSDASLDLDEASIPHEIAWKLYRPFIMRRLVQKGVPATKADEYIDSKNQLAVQALYAELKERPGIISRDPALHKFNLTGFYLRPNANPKDKTIKMNPLVFKSFNADLDGDQLNVQLPAGDEARKDVIDKMLPSKNLLGPRAFTPMYVPSNEAALGLFQSSTEDNRNEPIKYDSVQEVLNAFNSGKLSVGDRVEIIGEK